MKNSEQLTVDYFLLRQWVEDPTTEGMYHFYTKGKYKIRTRRNMFPLEIELFEDNVLIMCSYITTVGVWKKKTKKLNEKNF